MDFDDSFGFTPEEGALFWTQDHNPIADTFVTSKFKATSTEHERNMVTLTSLKVWKQPLSLLYTSREIGAGAYDNPLRLTDTREPYVYYHTIGMRFTLENVAYNSSGELIRKDSEKESNISTFDIDGRDFSWSNTDGKTGEKIAYVDVFWDKVDSSPLSVGARDRLNEMSAGDHRGVNSTQMLRTDIPAESENGSLIKSSYYIPDFLKREQNGSIRSECVVGQLILLKFGDERYLNHLPSGEWRVYGTHILQNISCMAVRDDNNRVKLLEDRKPRTVNGKVDVNTTLYDMLNSAGWSSSSSQLYIPALYNRYIEIEDNSIASTDASVQFYNISYGSENAQNHTIQKIYSLNSNLQITGEKNEKSKIDISYDGDTASPPTNLSLDFDMEVYGSAASAEGRVKSFRGLNIVGGDSKEKTVTDNQIGGDEFGVSFWLEKGKKDGSYSVYPAICYDGENRDKLPGFTTPYICVWVPLRSRVDVTVKYVASDTSDAILKKKESIGLDSTTGKFSLDVDRYSGGVKSELDALGYKLKDETLKSSYFVCGTDGWNYETGEAADKKFTNQHAQTLKKNGSAFGITSSGQGRTAQFTYSENLTDIVFYVYVEKTEEIPQENDTTLIVRYVVADGDAHLISDVGPISLGSNGEDITYTFTAQDEIKVGSKTYVPLDGEEALSCQRPLYGMFCEKTGVIPVSYTEAVRTTNQKNYHSATVSVVGDMTYRIVVKKGSREAMLYIPCREEVQSGDATVNIFYIRGDNASYYVLNKDTVSIDTRMYLDGSNSGFAEIPIWNDISDLGSGAHWKPLVNDTQANNHKYAAVYSHKKGASIGDLHYPFTYLNDYDDWKVAEFSRDINLQNTTSHMSVKLEAGVQSIELFVPCEIRTGSNPVEFYAIDAQSGRQLQSKLISSTFLEGNSGLIDVHDIEEIDVSGNRFVMVNAQMENALLYPHKLTALAFNIKTSAVSPYSTGGSYSTVQSMATVMHFEAIANPSAGQRQERYIYLDTSGCSIPSGNRIAVYVPYRRATSVNVYMLSEEHVDANPDECFLEKRLYKVSRSYWYNTDSAISYNPEDGGDIYRSGRFSFELPDEIEDEEGETYFLSTDSLTAVHDNDHCCGSLQVVGKQAAQCELCGGTGLINEQVTCTDCEGYGYLFCCERCHNTGHVKCYSKLNRYNEWTYSSACPDCEGRCRCTACDGSGKVLSPVRRCPQCNGSGIRIAAINFNTITGQELVRRMAINGTSSVTAVKTSCSYCHGTGHTHNFTCKRCGGDGRSDTSYVDESGYYQTVYNAENCSSCCGTGDIRYVKCTACSGRGNIPSYSNGYTVYKTCETCSGTGTLFNEDTQKPCPECNPVSYNGTAVRRTLCLHCNGSGRESYSLYTGGETKTRTCSACHGTGEFVCHTCDGSGYVDYDLCTSCYEQIYYYTSGDYSAGTRPGANYQSSNHYGTGYTVRYRTRCSACGDFGYTLCSECAGSGWSPSEVNKNDNNHALPCKKCGGNYYYIERQWKDSYYGGYWEPAHYEYRVGSGQSACSSCTNTGSYGGPVYNGDPDGAGYDTNSSLYRGEWHTAEDGTEYRSRTGYLTSGYYCSSCRVYIFPLGFPSDCFVQYQTDPWGNPVVSVYKKNTPKNSSGYSAFSQTQLDKLLIENPYRTVAVYENPIDVSNHCECGMPLLRNRKTYTEAVADTVHRTEVIVSESENEDKDEYTEVTVYIPDDSYTESTDVYAVYSPWQVFPTPVPLPTLPPVQPYTKEDNVVYSDMDTTQNRISIISGDNDEWFDVTEGIPSSENVKLKVEAKEYLLETKMSNTVGMMEIPVTVRLAYSFYESAKDYYSGEADPYETGYVEDVVTVKRPYSYWNLDGFTLYKLTESGAYNEAITEESGPDDSLLVKDSTFAPPAPGVEMHVLSSEQEHVELPDNIGYHTEILYEDVEASFELEETEGGYVLTVDMPYVDVKHGSKLPKLPELDEGFAQRIAESSIPRLQVKNDRLVFDGKVVLDDSNEERNSRTKSPDASLIGQPDIITLYSRNYMIPPGKTNGKYRTSDAYTDYTLCASVCAEDGEKLHYAVENVNHVKVHTPVYVEGFICEEADLIHERGAPLSCDDNTKYVQLAGADESRVYAVAGDNRDYVGYNGTIPNYALCTSDFVISLSNTVSEGNHHLEFPGYGDKTYDKYIYTSQPTALGTSGEVYNRVSFSTPVTIDRGFAGKWTPDFIANDFDVSLQAGEWVNIPSDTPLRVVVPEDTPEGRYTVTFTSVAINDTDVEHPLKGAMRRANLYFMSHSVYDTCEFEVVGKASGLQLTQRINADNTQTEYRDRVGRRNSIGLTAVPRSFPVMPSGTDGSVKMGYTYRYELETVGKLLNAPDSQLIVKPRLYYIPPQSILRDTDGKVTGINDTAGRMDADLWYDSGFYQGKSALVKLDPAGFTSVENAGGGQTRQKRFFTFSIPSGCHVCLKGTDVEQLLSYRGINFREDFWFKSGYLAVNFEIYVEYSDEEGVRQKIMYDNSATGDRFCNMWKLEGYDTTTGFVSGDVLLMPIGSSISDDYLVDHLN